MNYEGIIIGLGSFLIIGIFHPLVIKGEYYFSKRIWPIFLIAGLVAIGASLYVSNLMMGAFLGVLGFSCWWTIIELFEQEGRVKKGWFPANPKRDYGVPKERLLYKGNSDLTYNRKVTKEATRSSLQEKKN